MSRKRWTPKTAVTQSDLLFREKRKWQIALRRYVLEKNKSSFYAPYFGLDIATFRQWIELQFGPHCSWDNFSESWQFDHVVPLTYFSFDNDADLRLCWNFTNIRVEMAQPDENTPRRIDVLAAKSYFEALFQKTGYPICQKMVVKITGIEAAQLTGNGTLEDFIRQKKSLLQTLEECSAADYDRLNTGTDIQEIVFEKEFLKKFG